MSGIVGLISNILSTTIIQPIDVIKTRYQVTAMKQPINISSIVKNIYTKNNVKGFYSGLGTNLMTYPFFWEIYFQTAQLNTMRPTGNYITDKFITSFSSATLASVITNPLFILQTKT